MASIKSEAMLEHSTIIDRYRSDITMLTDPNVEDEQKLKIVQTLNENFEVKLYLVFILPYLQFFYFTSIIIDG